jgi:hypothetical protein
MVIQIRDILKPRKASWKGIKNMDEVNDARLLTIATERMAHYDPAAVISEEEINQRFGITEADLAGYEEVELE